MVHCNYYHRARAWLNPWHCNIMCNLQTTMISPCLHIFADLKAKFCSRVFCTSLLHYPIRLHPCSWTTWCWYSKKWLLSWGIVGHFVPYTALCSTVALNNISNIWHVTKGLAMMLAALPCLIWTITWDPDISFPNNQSTGSICWCMLGFQMTLFLHCLWIHGPKFNSITQETDEMLNF